MRRILLFLLLVSLSGFSSGSPRQTAGTDFTRQEDVIYGRKFGSALTLDVFTPKTNAKGIGVVLAISGGWFSDHSVIDGYLMPMRVAMVKRGYTVFAVVHGCTPKYTIPEILQDMNRAVRFVRFHAKDYNIDPNHIGMTGQSAGGHLSLMQGVSGDDGNPQAPDPIDRVSSRVQAVACFFPPTDFLNYGEIGIAANGIGALKEYAASFQFQQWNNDKKFIVPITDPAVIHAIVIQISPIYHVSSKTPPTLIFHGDADPLVPIQQSKIFIAKLNESKIPCELVIKHGGGHGWGDGVDAHYAQLCDWFDKYLR